MAAGTTTSREPLIRIDGVSRQFGDFLAVDELSLDIGGGEFFALLGPSGCGKTTLLRMLAGFETPDEGRILLDGEDITALPPYLRPVNMMFQNYALFPHLSVAGNIAFGLKRQGMEPALIASRVAEMVRLARLGGMEARKPAELSGGQKQRVALARALARRPRVLLLDEPLAALDRKLREETQFDLMDIQKRLGMTFVIVTHDQDEAMILASRIGVMNKGRLVQVGTPHEIYEHPATRYVAGFVGDINIFEGTVTGVSVGTVSLAIAGSARSLMLALPDTPDVGARMAVAIRPERLRVLRHGVMDAHEPNRIAARFVDSAYLGDTTLLRVRLGNGQMVRISTPNIGRIAAAPLFPEDAVDITFAADAGTVLKG